jgi:hypothetical protein
MKSELKVRGQVLVRTIQSHFFASEVSGTSRLKLNSVNHSVLKRQPLVNFSPVAWIERVSLECAILEEQVLTPRETEAF